MSVKHTHLDAQKCPSCEKTLEVVTSLSKGPKPGDPTLCWYCGAILRFQAGLRLKVLTSWEGIADGVRANLESISEQRRREVSN